MTSMLFIWGLVVATVLLVMVLRRPTTIRRNYDVPLTKCPLCSRYIMPFEKFDEDGINVYCQSCLGFIGIRQLGSDPSSTHMMTERTHRWPPRS